VALLIFQPVYQKYKIIERSMVGLTTLFFFCSITGVAGDQRRALFGQVYRPSMVKKKYLRHGLFIEISGQTYFID